MKVQAIVGLVSVFKVALEQVRASHVVARRFEADGLVESAQAYERVVQLPESGGVEREFKDSHSVSGLPISAHKFL